MWVAIRLLLGGGERVGQLMAEAAKRITPEIAPEVTEEIASRPLSFNSILLQNGRLGQAELVAQPATQRTNGSSSGRILSFRKS